MVQPIQTPPTLGQPPIAVHPAALADVALNDGAQATDLDDALARAGLTAKSACS